MIVLDTHIWIWWVHDDSKLPSHFREIILSNEDEEIGISVISCWEVAKLVERNRLILPIQTKEWLDLALGYPGIKLLTLSMEVIVESTQLPGDFHKDPADQLIVATARVNDCLLLTLDEKISRFPHVKTIPTNEH